jgi:predicted component of type VI protein secretion system
VGREPGDAGHARSGARRCARGRAAGGSQGLAGRGAATRRRAGSTIGRGGGCTISLPGDTFVSQVHARVVERDGQLFIEDLGSTNGTFLNGKQVAKTARVRKGDQMQIGSTVLRAERS